MKKAILIFLILLTLTSGKKKELIINETGFDNIMVGKTTLSEIRRKHPFAKYTKTFRHVLYRRNDGTMGRTYSYDYLKTKIGITYFFSDHRDVKDHRVLMRILFELPA